MYRFEPVGAEAWTRETAAPLGDLIVDLQAFAVRRLPGARPVGLAIVARQPPGRVVGWIAGVDLRGRLDALPERTWGVSPAEPADGLDLDALYRALRGYAGGRFAVTVPPTELVGWRLWRGHRPGRTQRYVAGTVAVLDAAVTTGVQPGLAASVPQGEAAWMQYLGLHVATRARAGHPAWRRMDVDWLRERLGARLELVVTARAGRPAAAVLVVRASTVARVVDVAWAQGPDAVEAVRAALQVAGQRVATAGVRLFDLGRPGAVGGPPPDALPAGTRTVPLVVVSTA